MAAHQFSHGRACNLRDATSGTIHNAKGFSEAHCQSKVKWPKQPEGEFDVRPFPSASQSPRPIVFASCCRSAIGTFCLALALSLPLSAHAAEPTAASPSSDGKTCRQKVQRQSWYGGTAAELTQMLITKGPAVQDCAVNHGSTRVQTASPSSPK